MMQVTVVNEQTSANLSEADYVRVRTWCDPAQDTVTLATIERVVHKSNPKPIGETQRIKTLVRRQQMSIDHALGLATRYAEAKKIRLVLAAVAE